MSCEKNMARQTFFSFHYTDDAWQVSQVRNSGVIRKKDTTGRFRDKADWQKVRNQSDAVIERWIDAQLDRTTVTVVLIGALTHTRRWVNYEIERSLQRRNGMLGVTIHNIKTQQGTPGTPGENPFDKFAIGGVGLLNGPPIYDWIEDDGRRNMALWIDAAARLASKAQSK